MASSKKGIGRAGSVESEFLKGSLSETVRYRLLVTGTLGTQELKQLIRRLELERETMAEDQDGDDLDRLTSNEDD